MWCQFRKWMQPATLRIDIDHCYSGCQKRTLVLLYKVGFFSFSLVHSHCSQILARAISWYPIALLSMESGQWTLSLCPLRASIIFTQFGDGVFFFMQSYVFWFFVQLFDLTVLFSLLYHLFCSALQSHYSVQFSDSSILFVQFSRRRNKTTHTKTIDNIRFQGWKTMRLNYGKTRVTTAIILKRNFCKPIHYR